jgi:hypothetical protein
MLIDLRNYREILGTHLSRLAVHRRAGSASNRHCWEIGSAGFMRSTTGRRSARLSCRAFVPKIIVDLQLADLPVRRSTCASLVAPSADAPSHPAVASSSCGSGSGAPQATRRPSGRPDRRHRHLRLERRAVLLPSPLHVLLPRNPRFPRGRAPP